MLQRPFAENFRINPIPQIWISIRNSWRYVNENVSVLWSEQIIDDSKEKEKETQKTWKWPKTYTHNTFTIKLYSFRQANSSFRHCMWWNGNWRKTNAISEPSPLLPLLLNYIDRRLRFSFHFTWPISLTWRSSDKPIYYMCVVCTILVCDYEIWVFRRPWDRCLDFSSFRLFCIGYMYESSATR